MKDVDGRNVEIHALCHKQYADANLSKHAEGEPFYWNFLEMEFDPSKSDPTIGMRVRNMVDSPNETPRGGGSLATTASKTGRTPSCRLPDVKTIPNAEVHILDGNGRPIRGTTSLDDGRIPIHGLIDVDPGDEVLIIAHRGDQSDTKKIRTLEVNG